MVRAALVQYSAQEVHLVRYKNVRNEEVLKPILMQAKDVQALVVYTVVAKALRSRIVEICNEAGLASIDLLGPILESLDVFFGVSNSAPQAGLLRSTNASYYRRIEAIEYTVKHDDGKTLAELDKADVILVGISRTSKTPLSIFLSHKGLKVANVPIVLHQSLPEQLFQIDQRKVAGLVIDLENLQKVRRSRLEKFGQDAGGTYASTAHIAEEIEYAAEIFRRNRRWPIFNVTERALEETASEIIRIVGSRMGWDEKSFY